MNSKKEKIMDKISVIFLITIFLICVAFLLYAGAILY
jgi:hypothetical protein